MSYSTNKLHVPIAEMPSPSVRKTKSSLHLKASPMNPSAAPRAVQHESRTRLEAVVMVVAP